MNICGEDISFDGMIVYSGLLVNIRLLIMLMGLMSGIDIDITLMMFNVSLRIGITGINTLSSSIILSIVVLQVSYFVVLYSRTYIVNDSICYSRCYNIVKLKRLNSITSVFLCSMIALVESESVIVVLLS